MARARRTFRAGTVNSIHHAGGGRPAQETLRNRFVDVYFEAESRLDVGRRQVGALTRCLLVHGSILPNRGRCNGRYWACAAPEACTLVPITIAEATAKSSVRPNRPIGLDVMDRTCVVVGAAGPDSVGSTMIALAARIVNWITEGAAPEAGRHTSR